MGEAPVIFEDVAVYFTRGEWEILNEEQKILYKEVMNNNYQLILSLNCPDIIQNIELGCEPYIRSHRDHTGFWREKSMAVGSSLQQISRDMTVSRCEAQVKRTRRYPRVNPFRWIKKDRKKKSRHSRSSHQISRKSEEKIMLSSERGGSDLSTCISKDPTSNTDDEPLQGGLCKNIQGRESVRTEEESGHGTTSDQHLPGEAVDSGENQEIMEGSGLKKDSRVTEDRKIDGQPEGTSVRTIMECHHQEDFTLDGHSKALLVSEASDPGPPKTENVEGVGSPPKKITASHHKKDRHVKFSEVVTMILIGERYEERDKERLLPVCNNLNDGDTKRKMKTPSGQDLVDIPSRGKNTPPKNVGGIKQKRKRAACEAEEAGSSRLDTTKGSKKKIVERAGTSQHAPSLESPTKQMLKQQHELRVMCNPIMKSEDGKVCSGPPPNTPPKNHQQKFIKSYSCANCGKITHWSKLNVQQKKNIERCMSHTCRMCGRRAAPAQKVPPLPFTTDAQYDDSSQPDNQRIPAYSSNRTGSPQILSAEKQQRQHKVEMKDELVTVKSGSLITVSDLRNKGPKSQDDNKSSVYKKCGSPGATVDPKPKTLHPKLKVEGSSSTAPGLESRKSKVLTKVKNVSRKSGDSKEHEGRAKNGTCYIAEQRKGQPIADEQKKPSVTQKVQDDLSSAEKKPSAYDSENLSSDKQCAKCGKSLKKHVNPENPGKGDENCVLRLKKRKGPPRVEEPFECKQCGKTFTRHFTLLQHRMIHTGERPYSCKECGKTFRDNGYLKVHMRSHTKEKPYTCSECGKRFGQNSAMVAHLRIHTDERPFKCNECGKRFSDRSTFRHHQMIHTGEKPFTCSFCGKKFTQQAHVKRHEKMHTGERPFGCTKCEKRFVDRTKLRKHELTHTRVKD
ncbi:uncharacterized protein LOC130324639 isoform X2 [Hyla sarda]|uniref:uncharacterized protein LOC130324639 isoform X2 n=1 Tax=Hyla sarda TaxID=327740 RepID=UPI0024C24C1D|nr:uncharacterized protein LOC130324639 isoform X2 [Hyla sarda]